MRRTRKSRPSKGIAPGEQLHPVQQAFIDHDAFQCGYCTPGQIVSAVACIQEGHATNAATVREWMSGNLCRCAGYPQITAAVLDAAQRMRREALMNNFEYVRAGSLQEAIESARRGIAQYIAGGTELLNWMRLGIAAPDRARRYRRIERSNVTSDAAAMSSSSARSRR